MNQRFILGGNADLHVSYALTRQGHLAQSDWGWCLIAADKKWTVFTLAERGNDRRDDWILFYAKIFNNLLSFSIFAIQSGPKVRKPFHGYS
ncbi:hypothetical protein ACT3RR_03910 [Ewingella sp. AOP8-B2-18]